MLAPKDAFDAPFAAALEQHARVRMPFEQARTELAHGERLQRANRRREARVPLTSAIATFTRLGAHPWRAEAQALAVRMREGI